MMRKIKRKIIGENSGILTQLDKKSLVNGQKDGESAEEYDADEMVDVVSVKLEDEEDEKENGRNLEREEEEGRKRRETEEEEEKERRREERRKGEQQRRGKERRRHLEGGLMRQYLGPNHHRGRWGRGSENLIREGVLFSFCGQFCGIGNIF